MKKEYYKNGTFLHVEKTGRIREKVIYIQIFYDSNDDIYTPIKHFPNLSILFYNT